jgi:hypothetical protein
VQRVEVCINGASVQQTEFVDEAETTIEVVLPPALFGEDVRTLLCFRISEPRSAKELGIGVDTRRLGILVKELRISPAG